MSNQVPEGWIEYSLKQTANSHDRYSFTGGPFGSDLKSEDYTENGIRIIQLQNIGDGEFKNKYKIYTSKEKADILFSCNIFPGDIILSKMGDPVARAVIIPKLAERFLMASDGIRLSIDKAKFDTKFVHDMINFESFRSQAVLNSTGSTRKRIGLTQLRELTFIAPPLPEQQKIAKILTSVDDVIEKTQAQIDKLKDLKTGMMQELLTKGVGVDGKPHTEFKDSPVGRIPKGWKVKTIADCCEKMTNGYVGSTRNIYVEKGIDYVLCQNVRPNWFVEKTHKYVSKEFHKKNIRACLKEGDVLTVQTGAGNGDTCVVPKSYEGANCHALIISRPKKGVLNSYFLSEYMNSDYGKNRVSIIATGGAHPHLNTTDLREEFIPIPPIDEQDKIISALRSVQKKYNLLEKKKIKLEGAKKALMQDLLTGKVRVQVD